MKEELEILMDKYWNGETSVEEEKTLRKLLANAEGYDSEKAFFLGIEDISEMKESRLPHPSQKKNLWLPFWMNIAAGLIIFIVSGWAIYQAQQHKAEQEAYREVMQAFALINSQLEKGTSSMQVMQDFKHLNAPQELFQTKEEN
ncbi:hypothetical protein ACFSKL_13200 [Belliella marina]|uniref:Anti-sigma factor n=1 Tax=Belliella marina TaxID=1644146 RepID=A0ABW4VNW1_9BACT